MSSRRQNLGRLFAACSGAGLFVVAVSVTGAQAAAPTAPHLSTAVVSVALPSKYGMPTEVRLVGKVTAVGTVVDLPCGSTAWKVPLTGARYIAAVYSTSRTSKASVSDSVWTLAAAVFTTPASAKSAAAALLKAEARCPRLQTTTAGAEVSTLSRTLSAATSSDHGQWTGYRTVAHLTTNASERSDRIFDTYLVRGNVIVKVQEIAPVTPGSGPRQDRYRKAVIVAALERLDSAG